MHAEVTILSSSGLFNKPVGLSVVICDTAITDALNNLSFVEANSGIARDFDFGTTHFPNRII